MVLTFHQCAPVRFVEGANSTAGPTCMNGTEFTAEWSSATATSSEEGNTTSSTPAAATSTPAGAGTALKAGAGSVLGIGLLVAALAL